MRLPIALLIAALVLAGCADNAPPVVKDDDFDTGEDLEATKDTGVIRGVVVDVTIAPLAGVTVQLVGTQQNATTNAQGMFGFAGVTPGNHFVDASKPGFQGARISVQVVAGDSAPDVQRIVMTEDPSTAPVAVPMSFRGHMGCSLSYIALCGLPGLSTATEDSFMGTFQLEGAPDWLNMEAVWEGTQPTGNSMNLNMGATPAGPATTFAVARGPSPLLATANTTTIQASGVGAGNDLVGRMFAWEMEGTGIDDHTGQCVYVVLTTYCQGPGAAIDQHFDLFVHAFYNWVPEEGWRFTSHGDPIPPS